MALDLLAGPFPLLLEGKPAKRHGDAFWVDGLGLALFGTWQDNSSYHGQGAWYGIVQPDGAVRVRNENPAGTYYADHLMWDCMRDDLIGHRPTVGMFEFRALTGSFLSPVAMAEFRLRDGSFLRYVTGTIERDQGAGFVSETAIFGILDDGYSDKAVFCPSRHADQVWLGLSGGRIVLYDTAARAVAAPPTGIAMPNVGIWYSRAYDAFVSLHEKPDLSLELRWWSNAARPAALSAPEFVDPPRAGWAGRVRARLTGSYGEPCAGHTVAWILTGDGALLDSRTDTDADGYAWTRYVAPMAVPGTAPQLAAQVEF